MKCSLLISAVALTCSLTSVMSGAEDLTHNDAPEGFTALFNGKISTVGLHITRTRTNLRQ